VYQGGVYPGRVYLAYTREASLGHGPASCEVIGQQDHRPPIPQPPTAGLAGVAPPPLKSPSLLARVLRRVGTPGQLSLRLSAHPDGWLRGSGFTGVGRAGSRLSRAAGHHFLAKYQEMVPEPAFGQPSTPGKGTKTASFSETGTAGHHFGLQTAQNGTGTRLSACSGPF